MASPTGSLSGEELGQQMEACRLALAGWHFSYHIVFMQSTQQVNDSKQGRMQITSCVLYSLG